MNTNEFFVIPDLGEEGAKVFENENIFFALLAITSRRAV